MPGHTHTANVATARTGTFVVYGRKMVPMEDVGEAFHWEHREDLVGALKTAVPVEEAPARGID